MRSVAVCAPGLIAAGLCACLLSGGAAGTTKEPETAAAGQPAAVPADVSPEVIAGTHPAVGASDTAFGAFLDRLMHAESAGRDTAANPRSTALGPFQFIKSTFLDVMRRHFPSDVAHLSESDILALRTDRGFARRAAEAFSRDNMDFLADKGLQPTFGHLRLAFLLGPSAAAKIMQAAPTRPVSHILDGSVIVANPFMRGMTAADLVARATRDVSPKGQPTGSQQVAAAEPAAPAAAVATPPADQPAAGMADAGPSAAAQPMQVADAGAAPAVQPEAPSADAALAPAPSAANEQRPAHASVDATRPAARSTTAAPVKRAASHQPGGKIVINVTCNERLPSCRRWINDQVNKALRTHTAADDTRRGA